MEKANAERIREFAAATYIIPARRRGEKTVQITAGDIHTALHLQNVVPNVWVLMSIPWQHYSLVPNLLILGSASLNGFC